MKVKIKKLNENVNIPVYAKNGDAGLDFIATKIIKEDDNSITYGTDLSIEIPFGYVGLVFPRSSIRNYNLMLSNSVGVIDSGYRGEIMVTLKKIRTIENKYNIGDKIFQMIILPYPMIEFEISDNLSDTERGDGSFGHSGK